MNKLFCFVLVSLGLLIFVLNMNHLGQQEIYKNSYLTLAKNILSLQEYGLSDDRNVFVSSFYPMWGYSILLIPGMLLGYPDFYVLVLQFILAIIGIYLFYKLFDIEEKLWHVPLFIPYFAYMSVKWPEAIVLFLILLFLFLFKKYLTNKSWIYLLFSGLSFGLMCNFRSDWLLLIPFTICLLILLWLFWRKQDLVKILFGIIIVFIITLICLLPWAIKSYQYDEQLRFTSTNTGGVLYISLGQLPNNPWQIEHADKYSWDYAKNQGFNNPYFPEANKVLTQAFIFNVKEHPISYGLKIGYNFVRSVIGGVYVGEYYTLFTSDKRTQELLDVKNNDGLISLLNYMSLNEKLVYCLYYILRLMFSLVFLILIVFVLYLLFKDFGLVNNTIVLVVLTFIIYKFLIIALIQYEPRHMNVIYLLLLGVMLRSNTLNNIFFLIKNKLKFND